MAMSWMRAVLLVIVLAEPVRAQEATIVATGVGARADAVLQEAAALGFSGQALIAVDGRVLLHKAYGFADRQNAIANSTTTRFGIASTSKMFAAAAILHLYERGGIGLQDSVGQHMPEAPADKRGLTVHQLLTHTAGMATGGGSVGSGMTQDSVVRRILHAPIAGAPGEWRYSGAGYTLLAALVERASGMPYHRYVTENLLAPAGMTRSSVVSGVNGNGADIARAYHGWTDAGTAERWAHDWGILGGGDVISTAADLYRWQRAWSEGVVVGDSIRRLAERPHAAIQAGTAYGYGRFVWLNGDSVWSIEHGGDELRGYNTAFFVYPERNAVLLILSNARDHVGRSMRQSVQRRLENLILHDSAVAVSQLGAVPAEQAAELAGTYVLSGRDRFHLVNTGGPLFLAAEGQAAVDALGIGAPNAQQLNARTAEAFGLAVAGSVDSAFTTLLGTANAESAGGLKGWWNSLVASDGPIVDVEILGTTRVGTATHTFVRLHSRNRGVTTIDRMIRIGWSADATPRLTGLDPDRISNYPIVLAVALDGNGSLIAADAFGGLAEAIRIERAETAGSLRIGGVEARGTGQTGWLPPR